jgi:hypothetical protein
VTRRLKFAAPLFAAAALAIVATQAAFADPRDFTFENNSGSTIYHLYVSPSNSAYWGSDVLGRDVLGPGERELIRFNPNVGDSCYYDILVVTADGRQTEKHGENLCAVSVEHYTENGGGRTA